MVEYLCEQSQPYKIAIYTIISIIRCRNLPQKAIELDYCLGNLGQNLLWPLGAKPLRISQRFHLQLTYMAPIICGAYYNIGRHFNYYKSFQPHVEL